MQIEYFQDPPYSIQIELVEGCSLACDFCGINGIREKAGGYKFMSEETLMKLCHLLNHAIENEGWNPRLEFAMHGEPSLHPQLFGFVGLIRGAVGPDISMVMFSNGSGFAKDPVTSLNATLDAGINTIGLDAYEHVNIVPRLMEKFGASGTTPVYYYPQQKEHNLHTGRRVGHRDIVVIQDIVVAKDGNHSTLNTHCGGGMQPGPVLKARCAKPFRELSIRWDGNVAICCNDFRGVYKVGNIADYATLTVLWNDDRFHSARKKLMRADRNFGPCAPCNAKSMRVGLLPDKYGKWDLGDPDEQDEAIIAEAIAGESFTPIVRRTWEPVSAAPLNWYDAKKGANRGDV